MFSPDENATIQQALTIIESHARKSGDVMTSPTASAGYCRLKLAGLEREAFWVLFLDSQHQLIEAECLFQGTLDGAAVYPREVVKAAIRHNSGAVILSHNHPSGICEPSQADRRITERLQAALALIDVRVLDHLIVTLDNSYSFAERGLL